MQAEVIAVGTELLLGQIANTNGRYLAERLAALGIDHYYQTVVGDNPRRLADAMRLALARSDVVITSGGLGPTADDLTKEAVAEVLGLPLEEDPVAAATLARWLAARGRRMTELQRRQVLLPRGAQALPNPAGTAPGVLLRAGGRLVVMLPGPPRELAPMWEEHVEPALRAEAARRGGGRVILSRVLHVVGMGEPEAAAVLSDLLQGENPTVAPTVSAGTVHFRITARAPDAAAARRLIAPVEEEVRRRLSWHVCGADGETLPAAVTAALRANGLTVAVGESCTGGMVGGMLTETPGSSAAFLGGVVAYADAAKTDLLGVPADVLAARGAVSEEVARLLAEGARRRFGADLGLGVTGIAGPGGATPEKPVGLVWVALAAAAGTSAARFLFAGSRADVRQRAAHAALVMLWRHLADRGG